MTSAKNSAKPRKKTTYRNLFRLSLGLISTLLLVIVGLIYERTQWPTAPLNLGGVDAHRTTILVAGPNGGQLGPGEEAWYTYHPTDLGHNWLKLGLSYYNYAPLDSTQFNFQILPYQNPNAVFQDGMMIGQVIGQGTTSEVAQVSTASHDLLWTGQISAHASYYVRVFNRTDQTLRFTLNAQTEPSGATGAIQASYSAPERTEASPPTSQNARQMQWTLAAQAMEGMTAEQATQWMRQAQAAGWLGGQENSLDSATLWQLAAEATTGKDSVEATQWLLHADSLGWLAVPAERVKDFDPPIPPVGGSEPDDNGANSQPNLPNSDAVAGQSVDGAGDNTEQPYQPIAIYPNNPIEFRLDQVNSGRLAPYSEHWYTMSVTRENNRWIEDLSLTMFTTPSNGFVDSRVNFALFPGGQYHIWERGTPLDMEHFGLGMWLSRDTDVNTGERLWAGTVVEGDDYFIKVTNDAPVEVDYYIIVGDVRNAELGDPTLHDSPQ